MNTINEAKVLSTINKIKCRKAMEPDIIGSGIESVGGK